MADPKDNQTDSQQNDNQSLQNLPINHIAYQVLRSQGFNNSEASNALKFSRANGSIINSKLSKKDDLTSSINLKLASKAHKKILSIFVDPQKNTNDSPIDLKGSDVTKAIDRVYDRVQPVKRSDGEHTSISFIQINIEGVDK